MSLKKYNIEDNYCFSGQRKIPFYKMDEKELIEALTPENSDSMEAMEDVTYWEFADIRNHPSVKETICVKESYIYSFIFRSGKKVNIRILPTEKIVLPPMTGDEIMAREGRGVRWCDYDRIVKSDDVKEIKQIPTKKMDFCEKWQQENYRKFEAILKDGRSLIFTIFD